MNSRSKTVFWFQITGVTLALLMLLGIGVCRAFRTVAQVERPLFEVHVSPTDACEAVHRKVIEQLYGRHPVSRSGCPGAKSSVWHDPANHVFIIVDQMDVQDQRGTPSVVRFQATARYTVAEDGRVHWTTISVTGR